MNLFDIAAGLALGVSALVGLMRGALREVSTVVAFVLASVIAILALRITGPVALAVVHPSWAANIVAIALVFVAAYILLKVMSASLSRSIHHGNALGAADRVIGAGFGLVRGLMLLGLFNLMFSAAVSIEKTPTWMSQAALYPLSQVCGAALRSLAPKGFAVVGHLKPVIERAVTVKKSPSSSAVGQSREKGYDAAARKGLDDVVEKSR